LRNAFVEITLEIETPLAVESAGCVEPTALASAPHRQSKLRWTALPGEAVTAEGALDNDGRAQAARGRTSRVLVPGVVPADAGDQAEPAADARAEAVAHALAPRVVRVLLEPARGRPRGGTGRAEVEVEKTEEEWTRERDQIDCRRAKEDFQAQDRRPSQKIRSLCVRELAACMRREP
jgi:hypothetical protein